MNDNSNFLVKSSWLKEHLQDDNLLIIDCQWDVNAYIRAHIPGALMRPGHPYIKSEKDGEPTKYLPTEQEFLKLMQSLGITNETEVICYDEWDNHFATRLWWLLYYFGHKKVRLLDGGWQAWVASGFAVSCKSAKPKAQVNPFVINKNTNYNVQMAEIMANIDNPEWQALDARTRLEFEGKDLRGNKRAGHIKGAIHLEWNSLLEANKSDGINYFKSPKDMRAMLDEIGLITEKTIAVYCQAGIRASFLAFCLEMLGYPKVRLYDGSMCEWANENHTILETA
jgi:thiosulfate/3-mercaptopyruvate sulfurtransferase